MASGQRGLQRGLKGRLRTVLLALDETILTETPPLCVGWGKRGQQMRVPITGNRGKRIRSGALNLCSGRLELAHSHRWTQDAFQTFLRQIRRRWRG